MKKISTILFLLFVGFAGFAQTESNPWALGVNLNPKEYKGDLGNDYFSFDNMHLNPGLTLNRYVNKFLDVNLSGNLGQYDYTSDSNQSFRANMFDLGLKARLKFDNDVILKQGATLAPYLTAGVGFDFFNPINDNIENTNFLNIPVGGGLRWNFNDWFNINYELTHNLNLNDEYDGNTRESGNDSYLAHQLGMNFGLNFGGKEKDSDKDGVADDLDKCPNTPKGMKVGADGCPEIMREIQSLAKNIYFETASDVLKVESYESLDKVAAILVGNPNANLSIEGHTDSQGDDAMNLDLSKRRAQSVLNYLSGKGADVSHLKAQGFGETKPVADNGTAEGRALNRRVELLLNF